MDIAYVMRRLVRRPVYVLGIVSVLAMAMGASLAVWRWVDALLLRPLDVPAADELVTFQRDYELRGVPQRRPDMSWAQVLRLRPVDALAHAAVSTTANDTLSRRVTAVTGDGALHHVPVRFVSANYLHVLGVPVQHGRDLNPEDDRLEAVPVALLTHHSWRKTTGSRTDVVGSVVQVNGVPTTIVGVVSRAFTGTDYGGEPPSMLLPLHAAPAIGRSSLAVGDIDARLATDDGDMPTVAPAQSFQMIARVRDGREQVEAEVVTRLRSDQWAMVPLSDTMLPFASRADLERFLHALLAGVALILTIACVHVGVLLGGQVDARRDELSTRVAIGASRGAMVRLLAIEAAVLAILAGAASAAVAVTIDRAFGALALPGGIAIDSLRSSAVRTAGASMALTLVTAAFVSLVPAWRVGRRSRTGTRRTQTTGAGRRPVLRVLAVAQTAAAVAMTLAAVFFLRTVSHGLSADVGFDTAGLMQIRIGLSPDQRDSSDGLTLAEALLDDVKALPGVRAAAIGPVPLIAGGDSAVRKFHIDGAPVSLPEPIDKVNASSDYFRTLRQTRMRGRDFGPQDVSEYGLGLVAIINESAARLFWPGVEPIGRRLVIDREVSPTGPHTGTERVVCRYPDPDSTPLCSIPVRVADYEIVGVVPDVVVHRLGETPRPAIYVPLSQSRGYSIGITGIAPIMVRSDETAATMARLVAERAAQRGMSVEGVSSVSQVRDEMLRPQRLARALLLLLGGTAVLITLAGTYASAHTTVLRERKSNAVRLALGATPGAVVAAGIRRVALTLTVGSLAGVLGLWWVRPLIERLGIGLPALEPLTMVGVSLAAIAAGVVAAYVPSRDVYAIDPARMLRE